MDKERLAEPAYRGTEVPLPIRWGMDDPPKATLYQKCVIVAAAGVGLALLVASMLVRL